MACISAQVNIVLCMSTLSTLVGFITPADASNFLGRPPSSLAEDMNLEVEQFLLGEMEKILGGEHRTFTESRLERIKHSLQPIYAAMEKNMMGKLDLPAVSFVLRRLLLDRHAWFVKGLEPESKSFAAWNTSKPTAMLGDTFSSNVTELFETRLTDGLGLHEIAVLAATLEHLVHQEALVRLRAAYASLQFSVEDVVSSKEASDILDSYMSIFILGVLSGDVHTITPSHVRTLRSNVSDMYPTFNETQAFVRRVQERVMPNRDYFYFSEVVAVVEEIGDRYGRWQNAECLTLKDHLVAIEDKSIGGAGRVRLVDFYKANLYQGRWEFSEADHYLKQLGVLDDSDPQNPRVIIANYINAPTNCVASTSYYSVCCIDECNGLLGHLEQQVGMPEAPPEKIAAIVAKLPSSTVLANRVLPAWLLHRLNEVAAHHGGRIPLHGRLFAQWMHYAYPRECSYPHVMGATRMQRGSHYSIEHQKLAWVSEEEMKAIVQASAPPPLNQSLEDDELLKMESVMWTMQEELVVSRTPAPVSESSWPFGASVRCLMLVAVLVSASLALLQSVGTTMSCRFDAGPQKGVEKFYV